MSDKIYASGNYFVETRDEALRYKQDHPEAEIKVLTRTTYPARPKAYYTRKAYFIINASQWNRIKNSETLFAAWTEESKYFTGSSDPTVGHRRSLDGLKAAIGYKCIEWNDPEKTNGSEKLTNWKANNFIEDFFFLNISESERESGLKDIKEYLAENKSDWIEPDPQA